MDQELEIIEASFNKKVKNWVSKQGLTFQLFHSCGFGSLTSTLLSLLKRVLVVGSLALIGLWIYLSHLPNSDGFREDVENQVMQGMNAGEVEIQNISRAKNGIFKGEMVLSSVIMSEGQHSFYEDRTEREEEISVVGRKSIVDNKYPATLTGVKMTPFGIADNYFTSWNGKRLAIQSIDIKLKTGAKTDPLALQSYSSIFKKYDSLHINEIQVFNATIHWGNSDTSSGSISEAELNIKKVEDRWEIDVKGGIFSHSWLKNMNIQQMKIICHQSGNVVIKSATLNKGKGNIELKASIRIQAKPKIAGSYQLKNMNVIDLLGNDYEDLLDGNVSGIGQLSGNLNTEEGIKVTTMIDLLGNEPSPKTVNPDTKDLEIQADQKENVLIIRGDYFPLLRLFQSKDPQNSYALLKAYKGKIKIENHGLDTSIEVQKFSCGRNDLVSMKGKFDYKLTEIDANKKDIDFSTLDRKDNEQDPYVLSNKKFTENKTDTDNITKTESDAEIAAKMETELNISYIRQFSGKLNLKINPSIFEQNKELLEVYPMDKEANKVLIEVPLEGLKEGLTGALAEKLSNKMKKKKNNH